MTVLLIFILSILCLWKVVTRPVISTICVVRSRWGKLRSRGPKLALERVENLKQLLGAYFKWGWQQFVYRIRSQTRIYRGLVRKQRIAKTLARNRRRKYWASQLATGIALVSFVRLHSRSALILFFILFVAYLNRESVAAFVVSSYVSYEVHSKTEALKQGIQR